jgi:hypothetical protein
MLRLAAGRQTATASWRCGGGIEIIISRACARVAMMRPSFKIIGSVSLRDHGMAGKARRGPLRSARTVEPMAADMLKGDRVSPRRGGADQSRKHPNSGASRTFSTSIK